MEYISIPNFSLTTDEEKELITAVKNLSKEWEKFYSSDYEKIRRIRAARNGENYEKPIKTLQNTDDNNNDAPDIHLPDLKNVGNIGTAELKEAIFKEDFLQMLAVDPMDKDLEAMATQAINALRESTNTDDEVEPQICDNIYYEGTCPVVIENQGRKNAEHRVVYRYELKIPEELKPALQNITHPVEPDIFTGQLPPVVPIEIGSKLVWKEEFDEEENGERFSKVDIYTDATDDEGTSTLVESFIDNQNDNALLQAEQFISQLGLDPRQAKVYPEGIETVETWTKGYPAPTILNFLNTYIEPSQSNNDKNTFTVIYCDDFKTQDILDNPDFINLDKLKDSEGNPKGKQTLTNTDKDSSTNDHKTFTTHDKYVTVKKGYFNHFRFKSQNTENGKSENKILRNFIVTIAEGGEEDALLECKPNLSFDEVNGKKISKNPFIIFKYYSVTGKNIGTSPAMDIEQLSKASNILFNVGLDRISRSGGRWAIEAGFEPEALGAEATFYKFDLSDPRYKNIGVTNIGDLVKEFPVDSASINLAFTQLPILRDYQNQLSNTSSAYFATKNNQTATEIATVANQASGISAAIIKGIGKTLTDMYQRMFNNAVEQGCIIDLVSIVDKENGDQKFETIDFSIFKGKKFVPVITTLKPELSNAIMAKIMQEVLAKVLEAQHPEILSRINISEFVQEILKLNKITNPKLVRNDTQAKQWLIENDLKEKLFDAVTTGKATVIPISQEPANPGTQPGNMAVPPGQG